jgi:hypothetical protein
MKCPRCQHENETAAKFCEECATPLPRTCTECGRQLSLTAKFCPEYAHPTGLSAAPAAAPQFASPQSYTPRHLAERRVSSRREISWVTAPREYHPATIAAKDIMREILSPSLTAPPRSSVGNGRYVAWEELKRLAEDSHPVQPMEALRTVLAYWLIAAFEPRKFRSDRALTFATAYAVFRLRELGTVRSTWDADRRAIKVSAVPGSEALEYFGMVLRRRLGVYLIGVERTMLAELEAQQQRARDLASLCFPASRGCEEPASLGTTVTTTT